MKLQNKVAIVTGGAMGNGLGIVKVFLKYGAKISILDYSEKLNETVNSLKEQGYEVDGYLVDIRNGEKVQEAVNKIAEKYQKIDILVNNAGVAKLTPFLETTDEIRDFHFDINIKGTWNVSKAVLPYMGENGSIVNLSSVTGTMVADTG
ncbi:MAG: SDR family NAD(P)-dependent oxidoreductase, partial [Intestinibacter sp.]